eukprot:11204261-Lingulodinium_polyedra.AAC.1
MARGHADEEGRVDKEGAEDVKAGARSEANILTREQNRAITDVPGVRGRDQGRSRWGSMQILSANTLTGRTVALD